MNRDEQLCIETDHQASTTQNKVLLIKSHYNEYFICKEEVRLSPNSTEFMDEKYCVTLIRDVAQIDIPTLLDVRTYRDRLLIFFFYKSEMRRFIVVIYKSEVYTRTYY